MIYLFCWLISPVIGALIGNAQGRPGAGAIWGLLLGPLGWLLMVAVPDIRPKCPECGGVVVSGVRRCKNCGTQLSAVQQTGSVTKVPSLAPSDSPSTDWSDPQWKEDLEVAQRNLYAAGLSESDSPQASPEEPRSGVQSNVHSQPVHTVAWYHYVCALAVAFVLGL